MGAGAGPWGAPEDLPIQTRLVVSSFQVHAYFAENVPFYLSLTLFFLLGLKTAATASTWLSVVSDPPWSPVICHQFSKPGHAATKMVFTILRLDAVQLKTLELPKGHNTWPLYLTQRHLHYSVLGKR